MECTDGQLACEGAKKIKVKITIDNKVENLNFDAPACIKHEKTGQQSGTDGIKCWRFWGTSNGTITFQHYACGKQAYYQPDASLKNSGAWLIVDGVKQNGDKYYYWNGIDEFRDSNARFVEVISAIQNTQGKVSGNCDSCIITGCQIIVTTEKGASYKSPKGKDCNFEVACDEDCPPDHVKCEHSAYPGYCCIPCKPTAEKINRLANKIR